jgi:3-oxoacyl-[acyl-carrier protein] reductase
MSRVVVVTGGNRGIGLAISQAFVALGDQVAVLSRSGEAPEGTHGFVCDVSSSDSVDAAFEAVEAALGPVEVAVANAGLTRDTLLMRMSDEDIDQVLNTNLFGAIRVARRASKGMMKLRTGRLIFIGSVVGLLGNPGQVNYSASKAGLVGVARSIARELGSRAITANVIAPGFIETDMTAALNETQKEAILKQIPLGSLGQASDIAEAALYLAGPGGRYVTGQVLTVDGGMVM